MANSPRKPQAIRWTAAGRKRIKDDLEEFRKLMDEHVHYPTEESRNMLEFVMIPAISLKWKTSKPVWGMIVGPPSSGKTMHLELLEDWEKSVFISSMSPKSLISGYRPDDDDLADPSLLPLLDGKMLIIKDFTTMLQAPKSDLHEVMGQLRDMFDGKASRALGNIGLQHYESHFNILLAVTPIIDAFASVNSNLGERFVSRREMDQTEESRMATTEFVMERLLGAPKTTFTFEEMKTKFQKLVDALPRVELHELVWDDDMKRKMMVGADLCTILRSHVPRDRSGVEPSTVSAPEYAPRLVQQVIQCVAAFAIANGLEKPDIRCWRFGTKVLRDSVPISVTSTLFVLYKLQKLAKEKGEQIHITVHDLIHTTRIGFTTTRKILMDLHLHHIVDKEQLSGSLKNAHAYHISEDGMAKLDMLGFFEGFREIDWEKNIPPKFKNLLDKDLDRK